MLCEAAPSQVLCVGSTCRSGSMLCQCAADHATGFVTEIRRDWFLYLNLRDWSVFPMKVVWDDLL